MDFINRFQKGNISQEIDEIKLIIDSESELLTRIIKESALLSSTSEALRMIKQGAVKLNDERVLDAKLTLQKGSSNIIQVGKKKVAKIFLQ